MKNHESDRDELFFAASPDELADGVKSTPDGRHVCLLCHTSFETGQVYPMDGKYFEGRRAASEHVTRAHGPVAHWLSGLDKRLSGLTDTQRELLACLLEGLDDKETASRLGISPSTVRNHRFQMRERVRQAKVFLAIMKWVEQASTATKPQDTLMEVKRGAKMVDERYSLTQKEYEEILNRYFPNGLDGAMTSFPVKEKRKLAILTHLVKRFEPGIRYTEKEVTEILKKAHADHATLRRYLIEYGFMSRERDCSAYWIKD